MANQVKQLAGRKYSVDSGGITTLKKDFIVIQDAVMAANGEAVSFTGVPAIGTAHPSFPGLYVQSYDVQEGEGALGEKALFVLANVRGQDVRRAVIAPQPGHQFRADLPQAPRYHDPLHDPLKLRIADSTSSMSASVWSALT